MTNRRPWRCRAEAFLAMALLSAFLLCAKGQVYQLRISMDNGPAHVVTRIVRDFAERVELRSGGRLQVRVYDGARLFRDQDVLAAVVQGKVEMACPGIWNLETFDPSVGAFLLPSLYGESAAASHRIADGGFGDTIASRFLDSYGIVVLGPWLDLGYAHLFTTEKRLERYADAKGLRIRVAGGKGNELRLRAFGAEVVTIAWPDFPLHLDRREVDGVLSTYETIASARLWEKGLRFVFEDAEYFPMYIPLINQEFLRSLPEELQALLSAEWKALVDESRERAAAAQEAAKRACLEQGMVVTVPTAQERDRARALLLPLEGQFVRRLGIPERMYELFAASRSP